MEVWHIIVAILVVLILVIIVWCFRETMIPRRWRRRRNWLFWNPERQYNLWRHIYARSYPYRYSNQLARDYDPGYLCVDNCQNMSNRQECMKECRANYGIPY